MGSVCSYFFAETLITNFSGKGLVPDRIIQSADFVFAVALAAATTVLLATRFSFPVSTTHGLVGALIGAGLIAVGTGVNFLQMPGGLTDSMFNANPCSSFRSRNWLKSPWNILAAYANYTVSPNTALSFKSLFFI